MSPPRPTAGRIVPRNNLSSGRERNGCLREAVTHSNVSTREKDLVRGQGKSKETTRKSARFDRPRTRLAVAKRPKNRKPRACREYVTIWHPDSVWGRHWRGSPTPLRECFRLAGDEFSVASEHQRSFMDGWVMVDSHRDIRRGGVCPHGWQAKQGWFGSAS